MELLHAYSTERLSKINDYQQPGGVWNNARGTRLQFKMSSEGARITADATGIRLRTDRESIYVDFSDALDPSRTESYWITAGWHIVADTPTAATASGGTTVLFDGNGIFTAASLFTEANGQVAYCEMAYNPITKDCKVSVNGRVVRQFNYTPKLVQVSLSWYTGVNQPYTLKSVFIARYEGNETPFQKRWNITTIPANTANVGGNASTLDATYRTVGESELSDTYTIPPRTKAVVVQSSMVSEATMSDLVVGINDGTKTVSKRVTDIPSALAATVDLKGHSMYAGSIIPTEGAATLTVGVKAVDKG